MAWICEIDASRTDASIFTIARLKRVIVSRGPDWRVDRTQVARLVNRVRAVPKPTVIYGMGEMLAYSHMGSSPVLPQLSTLTENQVAELLAVLQKYAKDYTPIPTFDDLAIRESLQKTELDVSLFQYARQYVERHPSPYRKIFGFSAATESLITLHPRAFGRWLATAPWGPVSHTVLSYIADRLIYSDPQDVFPSRLVMSGLPVLQAMASVSRVATFFNRTPHSFIDTYNWCRGVGAAEDVSYLLALPGLAAPINNQRAADSKALTAEQQFCGAILKRFSKNGPVTVEYSPLPEQGLADDKAALADAEAAITTFLDQVAANWPKSGLSAAGIAVQRSMLWPNSIELGSRLGSKIAEKCWRHAIFDDVIDEASEILGVNDLDSVLTSRTYFNVEEFPALTHWSSSAFVAREAEKGRLVGQRAALYLDPLIQRTKWVLQSPYAVARELNYETAMTRNAAALLFGYAIASNGPERGQAMSRLVLEILDEAEMLLRADHGGLVDSRLIDEVARQSVRFMSVTGAEDRRAAWSTDSRLPKFARALSVWSALDLALARGELATELLRDSTTQMFERDGKRLAHRGAILLDIAYSTAASRRSNALLERIHDVWATICQTWDKPYSDYGHRVFLTMQKSQDGDAVARRFFFTDRWWNQSNWAETLRLL